MDHARSHRACRARRTWRRLSHLLDKNRHHRGRLARQCQNSLRCPPRAAPLQRCPSAGRSPTDYSGKELSGNSRRRPGSIPASPGVCSAQAKWERFRSKGGEAIWNEGSKCRLGHNATQLMRHYRKARMYPSSG